MTVLPQYDEFGIYTTGDDVFCFVSSLFEQGISSEEDVYQKCLNKFGKTNLDLIEKVLYGED
jgi:hypothetical protein